MDSMKNSVCGPEDKTKECSRPSLPHFDHVFVTVDAGTLNSINECNFINSESLGRFAIRSAKSTLLDTYQPTRVYGKTNLVEIFQDRFGGNDLFVSHLCGIVLTFGQAGDMDRCRSLFKSAGIAFTGELVTRTTPDTSGGPDQILKYEFTRPYVGERNPLALFLHEVKPEPLAETGDNPKPSTKREPHQRFDLSLGRSHTTNQALEDIKGVRVWLQNHDIASIGNVLEIIGFKVIDNGEGIQIEGTGIDIDLNADGSRQDGAIELDLKLSRCLFEHQQDFGHKSKLIFPKPGHNELTGRWIFEPHR